MHFPFQAGGACRGDGSACWATAKKYSGGPCANCDIMTKVTSKYQGQYVCVQCFVFLYDTQHPNDKACLCPATTAALAGLASTRQVEGPHTTFAEVRPHATLVGYCALPSPPPPAGAAASSPMQLALPPPPANAITCGPMPPVGEALPAGGQTQALEQQAPQEASAPNAGGARPAAASAAGSTSWIPRAKPPPAWVMLGAPPLPPPPPNGPARDASMGAPPLPPPKDASMGAPSPPPPNRPVRDASVVVLQIQVDDLARGLQVLQNQVASIQEALLRMSSD